MFLIAGLGNIGDKYLKTRHNFGFMLVDQIISDFGFIEQSKKFSSQIFTANISNQKVVIIKPQTFMNNSGIAVSQVKNFFQIENKKVFIFHDDLDLDLGRIKVKYASSDAGHNGLKSIDEMISKNYYRLRLGITHPRNSENCKKTQPNISVADYVLQNFDDDEMKKVHEINRRISDLLELLIAEKIDEFINKFYLK
jgi:PTH1 family peptidyl-tRNA hydrolase